MKLSTNLKLLTKGYSIDDIKSIGSIEGITDDDALAIANGGISLADINSVVELTNESNTKEPKVDEPKVEEPEKEPDYKSLYEQEKLKVEKLQNKNVSESVGVEPEIKTDYQILVDLFKNDLRG